MPGDNSQPSLLDALSRGDHLAWQKFVRVYAPIVYLKCRRSKMTSDHAHAVVIAVFKEIRTQFPSRQKSGFQRFRIFLQQTVRAVLKDYLEEHSDCAHLSLDTVITDVAFSWDDPDSALLVGRLVTQLRKKAAADLTVRGTRGRDESTAVASPMANAPSLQPAVVDSTQTKLQMQDALSRQLVVELSGMLD